MPRPVSLAKSTNVASASWDEAAKSLHVTYTNGASYRFVNVTQDDVTSFEASRSPGSWLYRNLKGRGVRDG